jgi:hypothetical protein
MQLPPKNEETIYLTKTLSLLDLWVVKNETKVEARVEAKVEARVEARVEAKVEAKAKDTINSLSKF